MKPVSPVFDSAWREKAALASGRNSWFDELFPVMSTEHEIGLLNLRLWVESLPMNEEQRADFKRRLESHDSAEHWGAVAELTWWRLLQKHNIEAALIPTVKSQGNSRPDFEITRPTQFHAEVTTLNPSQKDIKAFSLGEGVALDHAETIRRFIGKLTEAKKKQLQYSRERGAPTVLAVFDSAISTGVGSYFKISFKDWLFGGEQSTSNTLPSDLSAIVYLRKSMHEGRTAVVKSSSAVFHNPDAKIELPHESLSFLPQHYLCTTFVEPTVKNQPIYI